MTNLNPAVWLRRLMLASLAATLATGLASSAARAAEPTRCEGTIAGAAARDGLVVPEGATCTIDPGADVKLRDTGKLSVAGSVTATYTPNVHAYDQTTIGGNFEIRSYRLIELAGINVHGTLSIQHNATHQSGDQVYVRRSELGGLVLKHNNGAFGDISDNRIATRLQCAQNGFGRFLFERNTVAGKPVTETDCRKP